MPPPRTRPAGVLTSKTPRVRPVILSGGGGTRLWPLSRAGAPKQFLSIVEDDSLLQSTAKRCSGEPFLDPIIVTGESHRRLVCDQLEAAAVQTSAILLEPAPRNTAPAIALAVFVSLAFGDDLVLVMPSDHVIKDVELWRQSVVAATPAALAGAIVAFGVTPSSPNTGYGYIRARPATPEEVVQDIESFIEKPDLATAVTLLDDPDCYWNSGMFLMRPSVFLEELRRFAPEIATATEKSMLASVKKEPFIRPDSSAFLDTPSDSIDYAVMERTGRARVIPVDFGWSDVGSWSSVRDVLDKDVDGNVLRGDVLAIDVRNSLLRCETDMTVAAVGLSDIVCIVTEDAAFIAPLDRAQDNKKIVELMRAQAHPSRDDSSPVGRSCGSYQTVDRDERSQVRRLMLKSGADQPFAPERSTPQHLIIVGGTAEVSVAGASKRLQANESILVPAGAAHRIKNVGSDTLHVISVECGSNLANVHPDHLGEPARNS